MASRSLPELTVHLANFSPQPPVDGWEHLFALARAADAAGVDRLTAADHVLFGENMEDFAKPELGGRTDAPQPTGPDGHWLDPLTTLAVISGMTSRIRMRTQILLAALRRPVTLAKTVATLDVLSHGRFDLGVGVGWQRTEYQAAGLIFENRGRLLDHTLEVCQTLWRDRQASYASPELTLEAVHQMPKPVQPGGVAIWISGSIRPPTVRRLARFGQRWIPWGPDDRALTESLPRLKDALAAAGGDPETLQATGPIPLVAGADGQMDVARTMERVPALVAAGQTDFGFHFRASLEPVAMEAKLREIVEAFRSTVGRA